MVGSGVISLNTLTRLLAGSAARSRSSSGERAEAVADDPDVLMAKALQRGRCRAAVEARLQRKGMHGAPG
ncbi:hypothetical protein KPZU09_66270 [Klebsiella pneumoniae]|uniref:Uncharacterized protein n=1 Tax=Klebsiella pneumoniae TaxID=573 RepID=A0A919LRW4_KLEPN|nr:hypothetical protein KPZU09_66270 [Klebsiella pneumoniae]